MEEVTISREDLYKKVWTTHLTQLAKEFKVSDTILRKKCLENNIPLPESGHWSKVKHGKKINVVSLPENQNASPIILVVKDDSGELHVSDKRSRIKLEISSKYSFHIEPTAKLTKPHRLVQEVSKNLSKKEPDYDGYIRSDTNQYINIKVSKEKIPLALNVFNSFILLAEARGHFVSIKGSNTIITIKGIEIKIDVRERSKRVLNQSRSSYHDYYDSVPSGILCLRREELYKREWNDSKKPLESQFPAIFASLELYADEQILWKKNAEKQWAKRDEEQKLKQEQYELQAKEFSDFNQLLAAASRWQKAELLRAYINHMQKISTNEEWIHWARKKADWIDPTSGMEDDILGPYTEEPPKKPNYW